MENRNVVVLAKNPARLQPAFDGCAYADEITFVGDLSLAEEIVQQKKPDAILLYKDIGFEGPQFSSVAHAESVKWAHTSGSGYEFMEPIERNDLTITNGQGLRSRYLAETLVGAMVSLNVGFFQYRSDQQKKQWNPTSFMPLEQQTLLVVGTGLIGTWFARYAKMLGMRLIGINRKGLMSEPFDEVVAFSEMDKVLGQADVVSLHLRHTPETEGLFDARRFGLMKDSAMFINTARGHICNEADLCDALDSRKIRCAYLDVFETEPLMEQSPLWSMDNVLLTPHCADMIEGWDVHAAKFFVKNLNLWRQGAPLENIVRTPTE